MTNRKKNTYPFSKTQIPQLLSWVAGHEYFSFLNGNDIQPLHGSFADILFVGRRSYLESNEDSFKKLDQLIHESGEWLYGYFSYDLKNEIEDLGSNNPISVPLNHLGFYLPEIIIRSIINPPDSMVTDPLMLEYEV